jgi:hypothetical protein
MTHLSDTGRIKSTSGRIFASQTFVDDADRPQRITNLIQFGLGILNGLIGMRFMLKLIAATPANPFAGLIYAITAPFVQIFKMPDLRWSFNGLELEIFSLIAIVVYTLFGSIIVNLLWLLFRHAR